MQYEFRPREALITGEGDGFPLTSPQAAIWLDWIKNEDDAKYNICNVVQLEGPLDVATFHRAIVQSDQENEALRLRLVRCEGDVRQYFAAACQPTDFGLIDLRLAHDAEAAALAEVEAVRTRPLDLENGRLCRHRLLQLGDRRYWWARVYHHMVCDGYTGHLMAERVADIYRARMTDTPIPATPYKSYRAFMATDAAYDSAPACARDLAYWRRRLAANRPVTRFTPAPGPGSANPTQYVQILNAAELARIEAVAKHCGTSQAAIMLSLFAVLLGQVTGERQPTLTLPMMNRMGRAERATPGVFACVVPFDVDLDTCGRFSDLAKEVFAQIRRDIRHIRLGPVRMNAARLGTRSLGSSGALFNSLDSLTPLDFCNLTTRRMNIHTGPVNDLGLIYFVQALGTLELEAELIWNYDANQIDLDTVQRVAARFRHFLQNVISDPDQEIATIASLSADDPDNLHQLRHNTTNHDSLPQRAGATTTQARGPGKVDARLLSQAIHDIWAGLIKTDDIPPDVNLFEIGAHSLLVSRAQFALSKLIGRKITSLEIFEHPTINQFVRHLGADVRQDTPLQDGRAPSAAVNDVVTPSLLVLSADSADACDQEIERAAELLDPGMRPAAFRALAEKYAARPQRPHRVAIVAADATSARTALGDKKAATRFAGIASRSNPSVTFLFPGQGAQRPGMARALHGSDAASAALIDQACEIVTDLSGPADLRDLLLAPQEAPALGQRFAQTECAQPGLFILGYALARYVMARGITPDSLLGHSIGEYVAACLAGVLTFEDGLRLVVARGRLMGSTAPGAMYAVAMTEAELGACLAEFGTALSIAAVNGPRQCVVSGPADGIDQLDAHLQQVGRPGRRLMVSRAFHSAMMEPILSAYRETVAGTRLSPPQIPMQSNLTGRWLSAAEATNPDYWSDHLRHAVRFADNIKLLNTHAPDGLIIECGFGNTASLLAAVNGVTPAQCIALQPSTSTKALESRHSAVDLQCAFARLWVQGARVDLDAVLGGTAKETAPIRAIKQSLEAPDGEPATTAWSHHPASRSSETREQGIL